MIYQSEGIRNKGTLEKSTMSMTNSYFFHKYIDFKQTCEYQIVESSFEQQNPKI